MRGVIGWIVDRNGRVLVTDFKSADPGTDVADRDFLLEQAARDRGTYVGSITQPRLPNRQPFFRFCSHVKAELMT